MGNQATSLGDEPFSGGFSSGGVTDNKNLQHFDHTFKGELHSCSGSIVASVFGECKFAKRPIQINCKGASMELIEDVGLSARTKIDVNYSQISAVGWDHGKSEVKFTISRSDDSTEENFVILTISNSIEFEGEMKLRFNGYASISRDFRIPASMYMGMFAGATKPKPFQRKRPNQSALPAGKLPTLHDMRNLALELHKGSYRPCPAGESRRLDLAMQHIYEGENSFGILSMRGIAGVSGQWSIHSVMCINDECILFKPHGQQSHHKVEFAFEDIREWQTLDHDLDRKGDSGIEITSQGGDAVFFGVVHVRDVKHTLEYFWNRYCTANGRPVKLGSTHGRPLVSITTLSGEIPPGETIAGSIDIVDQDGMVVRPGGRMVPRRASVTATVGITAKEPTTVPMENREMKKHWHKVVAHQGWLLKQGGIGIGTAKSWIKRYFVLYKTSQGHFLVYYSDFTECPMYTSDKNHRNIVDLAKTTFIRPGSLRQEVGEAPPHCFDIITTEREWTLCAETHENAAKWLKLLNQAVDDDNAILPDEDLLFRVKPKVDPVGVLPSADYSTTLRVSANGVMVSAPDAALNGEEREHFLWVYTDFYKWSLLSQTGKLALLVNVFADSSFSRRNEFIFRTKDAVRLATAIEYFIEKFMTVMHIRLETMDSAAVAAALSATAANNATAASSSSSSSSAAPTAFQFDSSVTVDDMYNHGGRDDVEVDLLGLDISDVPSYAPPPPLPIAAAAAGGSHALVPKVSAPIFDPFGDDPFGESSAVTVSTPTAPPPKPPVAVVASRLTNSDPFGDDPFGSSDPFGSAAPTVSAAAVVKIAPPLSSAQTAQHSSWRTAAIQAGGGPFYDDGTLQVATKLEVRGSQARVTFFYRNNSPGALSDFKVEVADPAGLLRQEMVPVATSMAGLSQVQQQLMIECVKPVNPGPDLKISYIDSLVGVRSNTLRLPISLFTFSEPVPMAGADFLSRWQQLGAPGLESQEVFKASQPIVPRQIQAALTTILKMAHITGGLPDESEFIIYGASSIRTGALTASGEKISVGCLVKIEMNVQAGAIRMTTRTLFAAASSAVIQTAKTFLA